MILWICYQVQDSSLLSHKLMFFSYLSLNAFNSELFYLDPSSGAHLMCSVYQKVGTNLMQSQFELWLGLPSYGLLSYMNSV